MSTNYSKNGLITSIIKKLSCNFWHNPPPQSQTCTLKIRTMVFTVQKIVQFCQFSAITQIISTINLGWKPCIKRYSGLLFLIILGVASASGVRNVCPVRIHFAVFIRQFYLIELFYEVIPQLLSVLHGEVFGIIFCRTDFHADYILFHCRIGFHQVPVRDSARSIC